MAVNFSALNNVYNHYLTSYAPKSSTSLDTHKKSELRSVYNSIIKLNKQTPLYIFDESKDYKSFAVNLKESARSLHNTIVSLDAPESGGALGKKVAYSSKEEIASVKFIGNLPDGSEPLSFELEVNSLASPQVNMGNYLQSSKSPSIPADLYSFDLSVNDLSYEFQFHINESDTNKQIQERLSRLINNADLGITAEVLEDGSGNSSLKLSSAQTGLDYGKDFIFNISDDQTSKTSGAVSYLGIGDVTRKASNADFKINGDEFSSFSNNFTIEKMYEISLNGLSSFENDTTQIGLKDNVESLMENMKTLLGSYNHFMSAVSNFSSIQTETSRLTKELSFATSAFTNEYSSLGLHANDEGLVTLDAERFQKANVSGESDDIISNIRSFTGALLAKTDQIALNPMEYADKKIAAYKNPNPNHNFANPYVTSSYSGMLFNSYC